MANLQDGVHAIRWVAERLDGFKAVADAIDKIGSLDAAIASRETALKTLNGQHDNAHARVAAALAEEDAVANRRAAAVRDHEERAAAIISSAHEQEAAILATAKANAQQITDAAKAEIEKRETAWQEHLKALRNEAADVLMKKQIAESDLNTAIERHGEVTRQIEALRDHARKVYEKGV